MAFRSRFCSPLLMMFVFVFLFFGHPTSANPIENNKNALVTNVKETNDGKFVHSTRTSTKESKSSPSLWNKNQRLVRAPPRRRFRRNESRKFKKCSYDMAERRRRTEIRSTKRTGRCVKDAEGNR